MATTVKYNLIGLETLARNLPYVRNHIVQRIAKQVPRRIINNIKKGLTGINEDGRLPQNETSTLAAKLRKGQPQDPLRATRKLTRITNWETKRTAKGFLISVKPIRKEIVKYLNDGIKSKSGLKIYKIMELGLTTPRWITLRIRKEIKNFLAKYV